MTMPWVLLRVERAYSDRQGQGRGSPECLGAGFAGLLHLQPAAARRVEQEAVAHVAEDAIEDVCAP
jgi:hypothetical protein